MAWRFMEQDFRMRSHLRQRWKARRWRTGRSRYADLEPCYEKAEWEIGVSGDDAGNPFAPPRQQAVPDAAASRTTAKRRMLEPAAKRLGLHPFPIPMLRNTVPYGGRPACIHCRYCVRLCLRGQRQSAARTTPSSRGAGDRQLRAADRLRRPREIQSTSAGGRAALSISTRTNRRRYQTADLVVVSCSADRNRAAAAELEIEAVPDRRGQPQRLGRPQPPGPRLCRRWGLFEQEIYDDVGPGASIAICDFNHGNPGLRRRGMLANEFIRLPYVFTGAAARAPRPGARTHKEFQRQFFRTFDRCPGTGAGDAGFRGRAWRWIRWSRTTGAFRWRGSPGTAIRTTSRSAGSRRRRPKQWLKEAGAVQTWRSMPGLGLSGGRSTRPGTCRMGNDPKTSVTNRYGQVHDIDNLFVADGSLHVTNGGFNPVLTIMALGYWVSDHIRQEWKGTRFR